MAVKMLVKLENIFYCVFLLASFFLLKEGTNRFLQTHMNATTFEHMYIYIHAHILMHTHIN